ncbi:MAG: hypothetical protein OEN23_03495 [Paracoccaceae bacterium]|nr:hypothetical protein [Paracoccaceae bacterium]
MRRGIQSFLVVAVVVLLPLFWLFRPPTALPARFDHADCRRIELTDTNTGRPLTGVEDMALMSDGDRVILSAADRLALDRHPRDAPEGGIYQIALPRIAGGEAWATPIVYPSQVEGGLFPHGIALSGDGERLAFVNRRRDGIVTIHGGRLGPGGLNITATRDDLALCRANDLAFTGEGPMKVRVTLDRGDCGIAWDDLKPSSTSGRVVGLDLARFEPAEAEMAGLAFANGIAGMYVAETRASRLTHRLDRPVTLPGGPDNLTFDPFGNLIVALHPSLMRVAAYRHGYRDNAPSRIVRVGQDRQFEVLFDDPLGELFSGASVAVYSDGMLLAGSIRDQGVLLCQGAPQ